MKKLTKPVSNSIYQGLIALVVFVSRWQLLPANFSPVGSYGFLGGYPGLFFLTIIAFDWLRGGFYPGFLFTYLGFAGYAWLGRLSQGRWRYQLLFLPLASGLFFLLSNFGVWWYWYPHTLTGLLTCYSLAVPFYGRTLLGDIVFGYGTLLIINYQKIKSAIHHFGLPIAAT